MDQDYTLIKCRTCKTDKLRKNIGLKVTARSVRGIDVDPEGAFWNGFQCPSCFKEAKRLAEQARYIKPKPKKLKSIVLSNCEYCNKEYVKKVHNKKYCSTECSKQASSHRNFPRVLKYRKLNCKICNAEYTPISATQVCCSTACSKTYRNKYSNTWAKANSSKKPKKIRKINFKCIEYPGERPCNECGKSYVATKQGHSMCSKKCSRAVWARTPEGRASITEAKRNSPKAKATHKYHKKLRKRKLKERIPPWASRAEIEAVYAACPPGHYVDHIIPINNSIVSGLHCPDNFQYLPILENSFKNNRFDGTYENESWRLDFKNLQIE